MLSSVLKSDTAIEVNIRIMRAFTAMRSFLMSNAHVFQRLETVEHHQLLMQTHLSDTDRKIEEILTYPHMELKHCTNVHDRFLIIDDTVYFIGGSIKDLGRKIVAFSRMHQNLDNILSRLR